MDTPFLVITWRAGSGALPSQFASARGFRPHLSPPDLRLFRTEIILQLLAPESSAVPSPFHFIFVSCEKSIVIFIILIWTPKMLQYLRRLACAHNQGLIFFYETRFRPNFILIKFYYLNISVYSFTRFFRNIDYRPYINTHLLLSIFLLPSILSSPLHPLLLILYF